MNQQPQSVIFDLKGSLDRLEGDRELLAELVQLFFSEYEQQIGELEQHCRALDKKQIEARAHSMKSALGNLGASAAYILSASIERSAREGSPIDFNAACVQLRAHVAAFRKAACEELKLTLA